ncbi:MAG: ribosome-binding factor A [Candidatus Vogelbacteria bacterium]|nr:ribosome-binding factor A [Candidatus Vogelbacteria bacterium]
MDDKEKRDNRISSLYMTLAAEFLEREATGGGMITVTGIHMSRDHKFVTILVTVFPDKFEENALHFAKRARSEFREYVASKTKGMAIHPTLDFEIDMGEKHRQKIDSLIQQTK